MIHKIIVITGQTATGKTKLAVQKALSENGELVNADSRQIYKRLDILTNKDLINHEFHKTQTTLGFDIGYYNIPQRIWLYDIVDPKQYFSAYDFERLAIPLLKDILSRGKTPIIIGGTYFYIQYLLYVRKSDNDEPNWSLRRKLDMKSVSQLQNMLKHVDNESFEKLNDSDRKNPRRLMRRIEIAKSGKKMPLLDTSKIRLHEKIGQEVSIDYIGLRYSDKEKLYKVIGEKINERLNKGGIEEVQQLVRDGYTKADPGMKTNGYLEFIEYLEGKITKDEAIKRWEIKEHQYAKRQYTFMKKDENISWVEV